MSKREIDDDGQSFAVKDGQRPFADAQVQFSDEDSDAFESEDEDEIFQQSEAEDDDELAGIEEPRAQVWLPGTQLAQNEVLEADQSAYETLHNINVKWPCLTFDTLWDNLGNERRTYPATCYIVTGTQADHAKHNEIQIIKCSNLVKTQVDDGSSISSAESLDEEPELSYRAIPITGGTNRIRATHTRGQPHLVASMNETGLVYIHNVESHIQSLDSLSDGPSILKDASLNQPTHIIKAHHSEGYAIDWSPLIFGKLITGDNQGRIFVTSRSDDGIFSTDAKPFSGHEPCSVEDLQWSPSEKTVFASCSSDGTIKIWDTRSKKRTAAITIKAHTTDVNVISWSPTVSYLIASGSDDGQISIWDLRTLAQQTTELPAQPVASYNWHKKAITSIQWHPSDESVFVASGADDQVTIWDLSVELDAEEQAAREAEGLGDVPSQLMFVHMGQQDIKEARWHEQISGLVITTAETGFNVFKSAHQS